MKFNAAVITVSDKGFQGLREDTSGPALCRLLESRGYEVIHTAIVPDERDRIEKGTAALLRYSACHADPHHRRHRFFPAGYHSGGYP